MDVSHASMAVMSLVLFDFDGFLVAVLILFFKADDDTILYIGSTAYAQLYVFLMAVIKP